MKVLLVDDNRLMLEGLQNLLDAHHIEVAGVAHDGLESIALARELEPDVILMDISMPRCDGLTATRMIKAENPAGLISVTTSSDGQIVDTTPPADVASVYDGTGADVSYATSGTTLSANWTQTSDSHTGIEKYWYAIGTSSGGGDVIGWTDVGNVTSVTKTGLILTDGQAYYFSVKAENPAGLQSTPVNSNGAVVDTTPPANIASVNDGTGTDIDITIASTNGIASNNHAFYN